MSLEDQTSSLEEAMSALREEMIKDLAESISVHEPFVDSYSDTNDFI
tara:strand:- start:1050 stop:1190 length:141 start_codon:yes stop_codon:yes gene_type:complete